MPPFCLLKMPRVDSKGFTALALFALSFVVYCLTLAPSITWRHEGTDGGDLIAAACTLGIPHPTGYPTYVLLAKLFSLLPWGETAFRVNLMSAFFAAGAVVLVYLSLVEGEWARAPEAVAASLSFGFSPLLWSQATVAEVYTLNTFFAAWLVYLWVKGLPLALFALSFGVALGNHLSIALLAPVGLSLLWRKRDVLNLKEILFSILAFFSGLAVYLYLPLRAAQWPPVNWGAPYTWSRFWWVVSGQLYHRFLFSLPWAYLWERIFSWLGLLARQFAWWGLLPGFFGLWELSQKNKEECLASGASFFLISAYALGYNTTDSYVYLLPAFMLFSLWMGRGLSLGYSLLSGFAWRRVFLGVILLLPLLSLCLNFSSLDLSAEVEAKEYGLKALDSAGLEGVIISFSDAHTFALWYFRYALGRREDVAILNAGLLQYDWYLENMRREHPDLALSSSLEELIAANLPFRPVYLTDPALLCGAYSLQPAGPIYRVTGQ